MCGLSGILRDSPGDPAELRRTVAEMADTLRHRGPDDDGIWINPPGTLAFGFRRLSIIDLSEAGRQPMTSESGRFTVVFNGEIYNHAELRRELEAIGASFRGHSDTEVLLAGFDRWGVEPSIRRAIGMFALALWDDRRSELHLIRDRLGIKPLFVGRAGSSVLFGSELKALLAAPGLSREVDRDALASFFRHLYVPGPRSVFRDVRKVPPGHILTLPRGGGPLPPSRPYWSLEEVARRGLEAPFEGSDDEAVEVAERLLGEAVRTRMYADVPLGALLSGGIDSSLVVALMQRAAGATPVKTYSVAFREEEYDEAGHGAAVARHLGTDHTEVTLTPEEAWRVVPRLPEMFDEPFASPSAIPNFLVCQVARRDVTVALSGTGGDEVFAGYNRYLAGERLIRVARGIPGPARALLTRALESVPERGWETWRRHSSVLPAAARRQPGRKARKMAALLGRDSAVEMYRSLVSAWADPGNVVVDGVPPPHAIDEVLGGGEFGRQRLLEGFLLADQRSYLVDDQLAKVDRVSMAVSLELRVPLLDHRVVELAWSLPRSMKRRGSEGKWILRRVLERHVPRDMFDRPKQGLSVPLEAWLRGPLRGWAEDIVHDPVFGRDGIVRVDVVEDAWRRLLEGEPGLGLAVWAALAYGAWSRRWLS